MVRAVVSLTFLVSILSTSFSNLGELPATILRPNGIMQLFSWRFYDVLMTPRGMSCLKWVMVLSLLMSTVGYLTTWSTKTSALLVLFYEGLLRSLGHFNHDEMLAVYCLIVLAFSPCGDRFSVDALPIDRVKKSELLYGYPILLMRLLVAWTYFSSALIKLKVAGLQYFSKDNLPVLAILHSLDNLHDTHFRYAFSLPAYRDYLPFVVGLVLLWEFVFPLAVFVKRLRWWILGFGILFHVSTLFLMNIFFPFGLAMYAVFVDWPRVAEWISKRRFLQRPSAWWRDFRSVPEQFPGVEVSKLSNNGLLLWDGECDFCARMLKRMRRFVRHPFADSPYQEVTEKLPEPVLKWSNRQAHWIDADGTVTGGSAAVIELLDAGGRKLSAAILSSPPLRPLTWLGYRIVASNRGLFGKFL
jgi:predicted DCC family thiol-disulfide oxidoreductase YuxK